jgi:hypothetical protein
MPRKAIDYQKVIIYKLVCNDLVVKDLYVGHTTDFTNRKKSHKSCSLNTNYTGYNFKVYKMIRDSGGWNNLSMIEIEKYPCNDDNEARSRERHWYEVLNANMNTCKPMIDINEMKQNSKAYYVQNKDRLLEYCKDYYDQNKDKILEHRNEKHKCLCGGCFTTVNKSHHSKSKKHLKYIQENESE